MPLEPVSSWLQAPSPARRAPPPGSAHTLLGELPALKANLPLAAEGDLGEGPGELCAPEPSESPPVLPVGPEIKGQTDLRGMWLPQVGGALLRAGADGQPSSASSRGAGPKEGHQAPAGAAAEAGPAQHCQPPGGPPAQWACQAGHQVSGLGGGWATEVTGLLRSGPQWLRPGAPQPGEGQEGLFLAWTVWSQTQA